MQALAEQRNDQTSTLWLGSSALAIRLLSQLTLGRAVAQDVRPG